MTRSNSSPAVLDVVALLHEPSQKPVRRGHVGTVVEELDPDTVLVEFTDERGAC